MQYNFDEIINRENTNCVKYDLRKEYFGNAEVMPLWVADMDFATPDFIREAIISRAEHPVYGYTIRKDEFFNSIINWMQKRHSWEVKKDWISFSPGIVPALNLAVLGYSSPGDKVLLQPPVYFPFFRAVKDHDREIIENVLVNSDRGYRIDWEDFGRKCSEADIFMFCHPHNPVSRCWTKEELTEIVRICKKNDVLILSDEIHSDLIMPGYRHIPLLEIEGAADITVAMYAPSKTFNLAGLSTSFLVCPDKQIKQKFDSMVDKMHIGMGNLFGNVALTAAYDHGEDWLEQLIKYLKANFDFMKEFISKRIPEIKITDLESTYLVWLDCSAFGLTDKELQKFMIFDAGLGLNHGPVFGKGGEGFQRINIATPRTNLETALVKLEKAVKSLRKK